MLMPEAVLFRAIFQSEMMIQSLLQVGVFRSVTFVGRVCNVEANPSVLLKRPHSDGRNGEDIIAVSRHVERK